MELTIKEVGNPGKQQCQGVNGAMAVIEILQFAI